MNAGILTAFQAKLLESAPPEQLRIGPCVLLDRLGRGEFSETYLAKSPGSLEQIVLKRVRLAAELSDSAFGRSQTLIERLRGLDNPFSIGPHFADRHEGDLILLSRHAAGPNCRELLVRRGRFPVEVVGQIARQLAVGLAALEARGCLHGQIQLTNVRLTASGHAILVDAGLGQALERGLLVRGDVPPEAYEGTAPELIGTGSPKTTASELYAFGCLLWHLLAGRPPFPTGDPLAKLAAHQSRAIPVIGEFAPDTPAPLADAVRALTQRDRSRRPPTFAEVAARFGNVTTRGHRRLGQFRRQFDTAAPLERTPAERRSRFSAATFAAILLTIAGVACIFSDVGLANRLVWLRSATTSVFSRTPAGTAEVTRNTVARPHQAKDATAPGFQPLPKPDADGVVRIDAGPYVAQGLSLVGDLSIRGTGGSASVVVVLDQPLRVICHKFTMHNVVLMRGSSAKPQSNGRPDGLSFGPLLALRSEEAFLDRCAFVPNGSASDQSAVVWSSVGARDPDAGRIRVANTVFLNAGTAVVCASPPSRLEVDNCLKVGGALFDLGEWPRTRDVQISARQLTLRHASALGLVKISMKAVPRAQLRAALDDCVFDLIGAQGGLLCVTSERTPFRHAPPFVVTGSGSVIRPNLPIVAWASSVGPAGRAADLSNAVVEGLAAGEFQFVGKTGTTPRDSAVDARTLQIPRRSDVPPGIAADRLSFLPTAPLGTEPQSATRMLAN